MPIDVFDETVITLSEAAKRLPRIRAGKRPHPATLYRWISAGRKSHRGTIVHLESVKVGGTTCTSLEALQRFFDRLTGDREVETPPTITERRRLRQIEEAEEALRRSGI